MRFPHGVKWLAILLLVLPQMLRAGTIVLANRTGEVVSLRMAGEDRKVSPGDVLSVRSGGSLAIRFGGSERPEYVVDPNAIYYFGKSSPSRIELVRVGLGGDSTSSSIFESDLLGDAAESAGAKGPAEPLTEIPVMLLVDDEEAGTREVWQRRLTARLAEASAIFERHCFVRFKLAALESWESDDAKIDFVESLADFESKVSAHPARLAIGFTSQYRLELGRTHLGGTRGPMHSHLLIREWSNRISEPERLEVLVHELGHFLGAVHSPEPDSVMRAVLGDKQARAASFRIGFDPVNTLAMCLVSDAMRAGNVDRFTEMNLATQLELHKLYGEIALADPRDKTPAQYVGVLERGSIKPLTDAITTVSLGVELAARSNSEIERRTGEKQDGDALTDIYVRAAATTAMRIPQDMGRRAFLLSLGIMLDRTASIEQHRLLGPVVERAGDRKSRELRLQVLGVPTAHGKHELARHFAIAAALTAVIGPRTAERACLAFQLRHDGQSGRFNRDYYRAELAGIAFAQQVLSDRLSLKDIANHFTIAEHLPAPDKAELSLPSAEFLKQYGSLADPRFQSLRTEVAADVRRVLEK